MSAVLADAYGLPVSTDSRAALDAYDAGVRGLLGFAADTVPRFRDAVERDPDFALARAALAVALYLIVRAGLRAYTEMLLAGAGA